MNDQPTRHPKLDAGYRNLLSIIEREQSVEGWVRVSPQVLPAIQKLPPELVETELIEDGWARTRLTETGKIVLPWIL